MSCFLGFEFDTKVKIAEVPGACSAIAATRNPSVRLNQSSMIKGAP
jgi:hypothetical protein